MPIYEVVHYNIGKDFIENYVLARNSFNSAADSIFVPVPPLDAFSIQMVHTTFTLIFTATWVLTRSEHSDVATIILLDMQGSGQLKELSIKHITPG